LQLLLSLLELTLLLEMLLLLTELLLATCDASGCPPGPIVAIGRVAPREAATVRLAQRRR
jgi:hypothetical protein